MSFRKEISRMTFFIFINFFQFISKQKEIKNILTTYFKNHLHIYKIHLSLQANKHLKKVTHELPYKTN